MKPSSHSVDVFTESVGGAKGHWNPLTILVRAGTAGCVKQLAIRLKYH
jgi:hypothetical protein